MPFSRTQIIQIEEVVTKAFDILEQLDLLELPGDLDGEAKTTRRKFWRRRELGLIVGQASYNTCDARRDYLSVLGHFHRLAGNTEKAEEIRQRGEYGSAATHSSASEAMRQIRQHQKAAGFSDGYVFGTIALQKFGESDVKQLTSKQLWNLCYTIKNRANAKLGKGETHNRNKSQTRKRRRRSAK